jgi:hypothetical protein
MRLRSARRHFSHPTVGRARIKFARACDTSSTSLLGYIQLNQRRTTYRMTTILFYFESSNRVAYSCIFVHDLFYFFFDVITWHSSI